MNVSVYLGRNFTHVSLDERKKLSIFHPVFILPIKFSPRNWLLDGYQHKRVVKHTLAQNLY